MGSLNITMNTQQTLIARYNEPQRFYHNLTHIQHLFLKLSNFLISMGPEGVPSFTNEIRGEAKYHGGMTAHQHREIVLMIWFHDSVFATDKENFANNEVLSAEFFLYTYNLKKTKLNGMAQVVYDGILASAKHVYTQDNLTVTQQIFLDLDLCGMGEDYDFFTANGETIRKEFEWVDETTFMANRKVFFNMLLARDNIYYHPLMRKKYEETTRANINRWLDENQDV